MYKKITSLVLLKFCIVKQASQNDKVMACPTDKHRLLNTGSNQLNKLHNPSHMYGFLWSPHTYTTGEYGENQVSINSFTKNVQDLKLFSRSVYII
jgi:uncharacterized protein YbaR (Trm112 family)